MFVSPYRVMNADVFPKLLQQTHLVIEPNQQIGQEGGYGMFLVYASRVYGSSHRQSSSR
jgi:hypothetical protein